MPKIERSALLAHPAKSLYELINDVESYPQYMGGCKQVDLISRSDTHLEARLHLSRAGISQQFTTRNELTPYSSMKMVLVDGPFSHFSGEWRFTALTEEACKVELVLDFAMANSLIGKAAGKLFEYTANEMLDSLVKRAKQVL